MSPTLLSSIPYPQDPGAKRCSTRKRICGCRPPTGELHLTASDRPHPRHIIPRWRPDGRGSALFPLIVIANRRVVDDTTHPSFHSMWGSPLTSRHSTYAHAMIDPCFIYANCSRRSISPSF